jgi:linoleoyl-CoA desaturase
MHFKTVFMLTLFFLPFTLITINVFNFWWFQLLMWSLMGFGMAGIGLSIMHDANHGAYSKNQTVNKIFGYCLNIVGGFDVNWRIQHNVLHHTYTNIIGMDEDVDAGIVLRFSDSQKRKPHHGYQHYYAWFLYGLMSISWILTKDFIQIVKYNKKNLVATQGTTLSKAVISLTIWKIVYLSYIIGLPIFFTGNIGVTIAGFLLMHFIAGLFLTTVFLCAHIVDQTDFPLPDQEGNIEKNWYVHQMETTANFSNRKSFFSWFIGGLNYQIEHHLFPTICHVHYYELSKIVKETANEFGLPYHANQSFLQALRHHANHLKIMGSKS